MLKLLELIINPIPNEMPQKFIVGLRDNSFIYCARYSNEGIEDKPDENPIAHNIIARDAGFDLDSNNLDVLGGGLCRYDEHQKALIISGSSGAYGAVPFMILQRFGSGLLKEYSKILPNLKRVELNNRDSYVKKEVKELLGKLSEV